MSKPIVAIVGRPNVGKSNLFNRILQKRVAIVEDEPGITRDRLYGEVEWLGKRFILVDTGGIEIDPTAQISSQVRYHAEIAIKEADIVLLVVDGNEGLTPGDKEVAELLRRSKKPVILVVNKIDHPKQEVNLWDFYSLGLEPIMSASAIHGLNIGDILDEVVSLFPPQKEFEQACEDDKKRIAVVGKPNVGKSSLINKIVGEERVIVSDIPGTTRDAIDLPVEKEGQHYLFIDTAGLRRPARVNVAWEKHSVLRTLRAIDRSDVVLILIDAIEGVTEQDKRISGYAHEAGRGIIIVINKWDIVEKDNNTMQEYENKIRLQLPFLSYAPLIFISAKTGQRVQRLFPLIDLVAANNQRQIATAQLNQVVSEAVQLRLPPTRKGRQGKVYYAAQTGVKPPTFLIFVNDPKLIHFSYERYLENKLREGYDFTGTPIWLRFQARK
ncbi:MAG: ribosome biogenesis GTPase Der [bacterium]